MTTSAIMAVTKGLRALLMSQMAAGRKVTLLPPGEEPPAGGSGVNLYLYRVNESPAFKNMPWPGDQSGAPPRPDPVLSLELFYMLTPFGPTPQTDDLEDEAHRALGEAMLGLHDNPILNRVHLPGFDADTELPQAILDSYEEVKTRLHPVSLDELSKIWSTIGKPYRLSVAYEVTLVQVTPDDAAPVSAGVVQTTELQLITLDAPRISALTPRSGPLATLSGSNVVPTTLSIDGFGLLFPGQAATVTLGEVEATVTGTPTDRHLDVTLPTSIPGGPDAEIQVTVNDLAGTPSIFTVDPWVSFMTPLRSALSEDDPSEAFITLQGRGLQDTAEVRGTGLVAWLVDTIEPGSDDATVIVAAPAGATSNATPGGDVPNGTYDVRVRLSGEALSNPRIFEVIPRVNGGGDPNPSTYDTGTRTITIKGARLDGTDVRITIDGEVFVVGTNANGEECTYQFGRGLLVGQHALTVSVDGHSSHQVIVTV